MADGDITLGLSIDKSSIQQSASEVQSVLTRSLDGQSVGAKFTQDLRVSISRGLDAVGGKGGWVDGSMVFNSASIQQAFGEVMAKTAHMTNEEFKQALLSGEIVGQSYESVEDAMQGIGQTIGETIEELGMMVESGQQLSPAFADAYKWLQQCLTQLQDMLGVSESVRYQLEDLETPKSQEAETVEVPDLSPMQQLTQATEQFRQGQMDLDMYNATLLQVLQTANITATALRQAGMSFQPRNKDAELLVSTLKKLVDEGHLSAEALDELGITFNEVGEKGKQSADKANNAHKNFQGTLTAVKYGLSAIGINGSSILGKLVTLVGLLEDAFRGAGSAAQSIIPILGIFLSIGMSVFSTIIKYARKLINVLTQIGHKLIELSTKAVGFAKKAVTSLTDKIKGFINFFKPSLSKLRKWLMQWGLGARSPYFVIRKIRTMVIDGMKEIAQYSDSVATSMNNFKTALNGVKGSVVSAFEPIASFVIPILTRLMNVLASVLNSIAKFNATLLGRSTYFKFVAADVNEYGNAVSEAGKASKKAQRDLMGFDEINRLSAPNDASGGGSGSDSTGKYVETAINEYSTLSTIAKNIREAWLGITGYDENGEPIYGTFEDSMNMLYDTFWDIGFKIGVNINAGLVKFNSNAKNYKQAAMKIGQSLAAAINGIVDTPALGYNIGAAIANVFNIVFSGLHQFATTVHWDKVGKFIGDGIAGALETFDWYQFFDTIVQFINGLADMIYNIAVGHDWGAIGKNIAQSIFNALKNFDAAKAGQAVHEFLGAIFDFMNGFIEQMSKPQKVGMKMEVDPKTGKLLSGEVISEYKTGWDLLADKINDFWNSLGSGDLGEKAGLAASGGFFGFFKVLSGGADLGKTVREFVDGFCKNINNYPWQSAMHDWWNVFYPKLKSFLEWAGPKIVELLQWLWDTIAPKVLEIAADIGSAIAKGIKDALFTGLGKKITDAFLGYDYEEASKQAAIENDQDSMEAMKVKISMLNDAGVQKLKDHWDELSDITKENLMKYRSEFSDMVKDTATVTDQTATVIDDSTKKVQKSYNTAAESARQTGEAQHASAQVVADSSKDTANVVQNTSAKIQKSNQTSQQEFATTATSAATAASDITTSTTTMGSVITAGLQGIQDASDTTFASIEPAAQGAYDDMTATFDGATGYFQNLWNTVTDTFSVNGDIAKGLATGMGLIMNTSVNKMIDAINTYAIDPLIRLSNAVEIIKGFSFGGLKPFANLPKLNFFRIPKLAQGAVLPPNQPFLSMVGDQKSGTNVEAPLETIKQAVAEVMMENNDLLTAGFEAVVRAIQNKDMSVRIGDKDIYDANSNYEKRLNIMRGTV